MHAAILLLGLPLHLAPLSAAPVAAPAPALATQDNADERYRFIAGLCEQGHWEMAVREAESFLEDHPHHGRVPWVRYRLASALFELDRPEEAVPHYRRLARAEGFEFRAETLLRLGQCELLAERYDRALEALEAALAADQEYLKPTAAFFLAETEFHLERHAAAARHYEAALASEEAAPYHAHARRGLAWCRFRLDDHPGCARAARAFLKENPDHALASEVRFLLGDSLARSGEAAAAEQAWAPIESGDFHAAALRGRAYLRSKAGDERGAARLFAALLDAEPRGPYAREAAVQCGAHLLRAGSPREALQVLELPAAGEDAESLYWRARAQAATGDKEAALRSLERAASGAEGELAARVAAARGDLLYELGRLTESAAAYEGDASDYGLHAAATARLNAGDARGALELAERFRRDFDASPYRASTLAVRAEALFQLERFEEALAAWSELVDEAAGLDANARGRARERAAWCHYRLGAREEAARQFGAVARDLADAPEADQAHFMQGRALREAGRLEEAARVWTRYLQQRPRGAHRGEARLELARLGGGSEHLEALLEERPDAELEAIALFELAESRARGGEQRAAIETYRRFLERYPQDPSAPEARYGLAWSLREEGEARAALGQIEELLTADPKDELLVDALEMTIWCARDLGETPIARAAWRRFAELCHDDARRAAAARVVARELQRTGEAQEATELLAGLRNETGASGLQLDLLIEEVWVALEAEDAARAETLVREALQRAASDARVQEAAFFCGEARYARAEYRAAGDLYRAAARPENGELEDDALYKLGFALLASGESAPAAEAFERLVAEHGASELFGESLFLAGECRWRAAQLEPSLAHLERFRAEVKRHAVRPKALFRLGLAAAELGRAKLARSALTELLKSSPDFENRLEARLELGRACAALEEPRAARAAFDALLTEAQATEGAAVFVARARLEIGRLHAEAGEHDEALSQFLKVSLLFGGGAEVQEATYLAGHCLEAQGERAMAVEQYRKLVRDAPESDFGRAAAVRLRELADD